MPSRSARFRVASEKLQLEDFKPMESLRRIERAQNDKEAYVVPSLTAILPF
jgi:hypothetical protein